LTKSKDFGNHKYRLRFVVAALDEWQKLDGSIKEPLRKALKKRLDNPHVPSARLHGDLNACYKIKLSTIGYRLVYSVEDDTLIVLVLSGLVVYQDEAERRAPE
jgi:mRNA interferase RelE/StbE